MGKQQCTSLMCWGSAGSGVPCAEPGEMHLASCVSPKQPPHRRGHLRMLEATMAPGFPSVFGLLFALHYLQANNEEFGFLMTLQFANMFQLFFLVLSLAELHS